MTMPDGAQALMDGIYSEDDPTNGAIMSTLVAGGFPVEPPAKWFENPQLTKPTPLQVTAEGRVYGHIAPWGVSHIGMAGSVVTPKNPTGRYPYFRTGYIVAAGGKKFDVGQLTLVGGHAPIGANHVDAVKHYDDTASAMADVVCGEDAHGIWAAGALRPNVTPEQVRAMRACPPSGDWRPINGRLELVAACHVNCQGFPIAKTMVAGGAITALVAAGAGQMYALRQAELVEPDLVARLDDLQLKFEALAASGVALAEPPVAEVVETPEVVPVEEAAPTVTDPTVDEQIPETPAEPVVEEVVEEPTAEELERAATIADARDQVAKMKRQMLRDQVHGSAAPVTASTIQGTDSFPITDVASLKKAIQANGRAKNPEAAKKHIISMAYKLKRPDLIPTAWRK